MKGSAAYTWRTEHHGTDTQWRSRVMDLYYRTFSPSLADDDGFLPFHINFHSSTKGFVTDMAIVIESQSHRIESQS